MAAQNRYITWDRIKEGPESPFIVPMTIVVTARGSGKSTMSWNLNQEYWKKGEKICWMRATDTEMDSAKAWFKSKDNSLIIDAKGMIWKPAVKGYDEDKKKPIYDKKDLENLGMIVNLKSSYQYASGLPEDMTLLVYDEFIHRSGVMVKNEYKIFMDFVISWERFKVDENGVPKGQILLLGNAITGFTPFFDMLGVDYTELTSWKTYVKPPMFTERLEKNLQHIREELANCDSFTQEEIEKRDFSDLQALKDYLNEAERDLLQKLEIADRIRIKIIIDDGSVFKANDTQLSISNMLASADDSIYDYAFRNQFKDNRDNILMIRKWPKELLPWQQIILDGEWFGIYMDKTDSTVYIRRLFDKDDKIPSDQTFAFKMADYARVKDCVRITIDDAKEDYVNFFLPYITAQKNDLLFYATNEEKEIFNKLYEYVYGVRGNML